MLNQLLGGHYQVIKNLGQGGLAKTYIVEDLHRPGNPKCVVKFLYLANNDPSFLPTARRLFHQEAEMLEKLGEHDQIPRLLAYFEQNQEFYLVQEFIEGHTLSMELKRGQHWSESRVIQMLQDVLPVLEFVHGYNVIHRDIKPNNLIRRKRDGRLMLIDFGAVKQIRAPKTIDKESMNPNTIFIGTNGYVPIEQVKGKPCLNSDIYALGIVCIQALTGVMPNNFHEDQNGEIIWQNMVNVSDELAAIISKMVCYRSCNRYQSATEVLEALQALTNHVFPAKLVTRGASLKVVPEKKEINNVSSFADSSSPSKDLKYVQASQVIEKTQPAINQDSIFPPTFPIKPLTSKTSSENNEQNNLSYFSNLLPQSEDLDTIDYNLNSGADPLALSEDLDTVHCAILRPFNKSLWPFNKSLWLIGAGIISGFVSIFAGYTYVTHKHNYFNAQKLLEQIEVMKTEKKYQECLQQIQAFPSNYSQLHTKAQTFLHDCREGQAEVQLTEAKQLAEQNRFKDAITLASQVFANSNVYSEAQQLISNWSEEIFKIASNKYQEGNLKEAIAIAEAIPTSNPWAKKSQESIQQWNEDWTQNQNHLQVAQKAIDESRWQDAINTAQKINNNAYWQKQSEEIIQKAKAEIVRIQVAASRRTYKPRSTSSVRRPSRSYRSSSSRSSSSRRRSSRSYRSSSSRSSKSRPTPRRRYYSGSSRRLRTVRLPSRSSSSRSSSSRSRNWTCLNNPSRKCRR